MVQNKLQLSRFKLKNPQLSTALSFFPAQIFRLFSLSLFPSVSLLIPLSFLLCLSLPLYLFPLSISIPLYIFHITYRHSFSKCVNLICQELGVSCFPNLQIYDSLTPHVMIGCDERRWPVWTQSSQCLSHNQWVQNANLTFRDTWTCSFPFAWALLHPRVHGSNIIVFQSINDCADLMSTNKNAMGYRRLSSSIDTLFHQNHLEL